MSALPAPESFLSGRTGHVGPRRAAPLRGADALLDLGLRLRRVPARLDRLDATVPVRRVTAACVHRPRSDRLSAIAEELHRSRHEVRLALGSTAELQGGKFENLNVLLGQAGDPPDWTLIVDDDVILPARFVDRLIAVCEELDLALAQPAQTLASHAAWRVARRRPLSIARRTSFVEIGPVTVIRRDAAAELVPFPELRFGWGLDLHWAALAREKGWRLGVIDALPVRHDHGGVASAYRHEDAVAEAQSFLADRPYLSSAEAEKAGSPMEPAP